MAKNKLKTTDDFKLDAYEVYGDKYDLSLVIYTGNKNKVSIICRDHGVFNRTPNDFLSKKCGCPKCGYSKTSEKLRVKNQLYIERANKVHNNRYDYSLMEYKNNKTKIKILCPEHGVFEQRPDAHLFQSQGCPVCNFSKGEVSVMNYFLRNNIKYISEYVINDCKNTFPLPFDFYLPEHNICVEYDGIQHYKPVYIFGGEEGLKKTKERDIIKNNYCKSNNIKLIRIKYNECVENKLNKILK